MSIKSSAVTKKAEEMNGLVTSKKQLPISNSSSNILLNWKLGMANKR